MLIAAFYIRPNRRNADGSRILRYLPAVVSASVCRFMYVCVCVSRAYDMLMLNAKHHQLACNALSSQCLPRFVFFTINLRNFHQTISQFFINLICFFFHFFSFPSIFFQLQMIAKIQHVTQRSCSNNSNSNQVLIFSCRFVGSVQEGRPNDRELFQNVRIGSFWGNSFLALSSPQFGRSAVALFRNSFLMLFVSMWVWTLLSLCFIVFFLIEVSNTRMNQIASVWFGSVCLFSLCRFSETNETN